MSTETQLLREALDWHCDGTPEAEMSESERSLVNKLLAFFGYGSVEEYVATTTERRD